MIINRRNKLCIAQQTKVANHIWGRMLGLMGKRSLDEHHALFIYPCQQIHTFFMRFPIDCVFINQDYKVIYLLEHVRPWRVSEKVSEAYGVIELASGVIQKTDINISDRLEIRL